jgi:hypothetical protein
MNEHPNHVNHAQIMLSGTSFSDCNNLRRKSKNYLAQMEKVRFA